MSTTKVVTVKRRAPPKKRYYKKKAPAPARRIVYKGNGAYSKRKAASDWLAPPSSLGSTIGGWLGHGAQQVIRAVTGFGDYHVQYNSLMGGVEPPEIVNSRRSGGIVVRHREYIMDIAGSQSFTIDQLSINPGLVSSFPWLSTIASSFEEYRLRGLIYEFKSMSSDAVLSSGTNSALGTVIMATQYNSLMPIFPDKKTMENYEFANSSKPSCSFVHPVECKQSINPVQELYVRTGTPTTGDLRLYDLGAFYIATQGQQADGGIIGELWATFEVEFFKPKLINALGYNLLTDHWQLNGVTDTLTLGNATLNVLKDGSQLGTIIASKTIFFPPYVSDGHFLIHYNVVGSATALSGPTLTYTNCRGVDIFINDSQSAASTGTPTDVIYIKTFAIEILSANATIAFSSATLPASSTSGDLIITQINGSIVS